MSVVGALSPSRSAVDKPLDVGHDSLQPEDLSDTASRLLADTAVRWKAHPWNSSMRRGDALFRTQRHAVAAATRTAESIGGDQFRRRPFRSLAKNELTRNAMLAAAVLIP